MLLVIERLQAITFRDGDIWRHLMHLGGNCLLDLKRYEEAEAWFSEVWIKLKDPIALGSRGVSKWMQGKAAEALIDYLEAIPIYPSTESVELPLRKAAQLSLEVGDPLNALKYVNEYERRFGITEWTKDFRRRISNYCAS